MKIPSLKFIIILFLLNILWILTLLSYNINSNFLYPKFISSSFDPEAKFEFDSLILKSISEYFSNFLPKLSIISKHVGDIPNGKNNNNNKKYNDEYTKKMNEKIRKNYDMPKPFIPKKEIPIKINSPSINDLIIVSQNNSNQKIKKSYNINNNYNNNNYNFQNININNNNYLNNNILNNNNNNNRENNPYNISNIASKQRNKNIATLESKNTQISFLKNEEMLKQIKNTIDDNLKIMFNFSYENFLSKESEQESKEVSREIDMNVSNENI